MIKVTAQTKVHEKMNQTNKTQVALTKAFGFVIFGLFLFLLYKQVFKRSQ